MFADPDYCMRYIRCNKELFVRRRQILLGDEITRYFICQASREYCTTGTFFDELAEKCKVLAGWEENISLIIACQVSGRARWTVVTGNRSTWDLKTTLSGDFNYFDKTVLSLLSVSRLVNC